MSDTFKLFMIFGEILLLEGELLGNIVVDTLTKEPLHSPFANERDQLQLWNVKTSWIHQNICKVIGYQQIHPWLTAVGALGNEK